MKKRLAMSLLVLLLVPTLAFAHAGEAHSYMGTITTLHHDGSFMLEKTDGKSFHVLVAKTTVYLHSDGQAAKKSELKAGSRVVVKMSKDGKTAVNVKMAAAKKT
jgi:hypothetical protein